MTARLKHILRTLLVLALALAVFITAGVYNVSARAGHWPMTAWFLHFIMRQSARTHALGIEVPPLDDKRMIIRGATYFAVGCAACHGQPGAGLTPIVHYMTPEAPRLGPLIENWDTRQLFWIVDNGIKYTGMPAWATANRPDEVWSMVAFLKTLPDLDDDAYRKLAFEPDPKADVEPSITSLEIDEKGTGTLQQCARCHGYDGMGHSTGAFPYLAGQKEAYLYESLKSYADGMRASGIMQPIAAGLNEGSMKKLARHYASVMPPHDASHPRTAIEDMARGRDIAINGIPEQGIPACRHCHGPGRVADNPAFPQLAGQNYSYLVTQLELWKNETRGGSAYAPLMATVAGGLKDEQMRSVAAWYASLAWTSAGHSDVHP